jgi:hypothetical protein
MLSPPFLELAYYVGVSDAPNALSAALGVRPINGGVSVAAPNIIGIAAGEEAVILGGVLVFRTEGEAFSGPLASKRVADAQGLKVRERFLELATNIGRCAYGAILVEYSLEEPEELRNDPRSLAFCDFYVGSASLEQTAVCEIVELAGKDSFVEFLADGVYVSMSRWFNPERRAVGAEESMERSARIGAIVGRAVRTR